MISFGNLIIKLSHKELKEIKHYNPKNLTVRYIPAKEKVNENEVNQMRIGYIIDLNGGSTSEVYSCFCNILCFLRHTRAVAVKIAARLKRHIDCGKPPNVTSIQ